MSSFAITDSTVYAISSDDTTMWRYRSGTTWDTIDYVADGSDYAVSAGGADNMVVTSDPSNILWQYNNPGAGQWASIDSPAVQHVVNEDGVYEITLNNDYMWRFDNNRAWTQIDSGYERELVVGSWMVSSVSYNTNNIWNWDDLHNQWWSNGHSAYQYAITTLTGTPSLFALSSPLGSSTLTRSTNVYATQPTWASASVSGISRLVSGGDKLYAVTLPCPPRPKQAQPGWQTRAAETRCDGDKRNPPELRRAQRAARVAMVARLRLGFARDSDRRTLNLGRRYVESGRSATLSHRGPQVVHRSRAPSADPRAISTVAVGAHPNWTVRVSAARSTASGRVRAAAVPRCRIS